MINVFFVVMIAQARAVVLNIALAPSQASAIVDIVTLFATIKKDFILSLAKHVADCGDIMLFSRVRAHRLISNFIVNLHSSLL